MRHGRLRAGGQGSGVGGGPFWEYCHRAQREGMPTGCPHAPPGHTRPGLGGTTGQPRRGAREFNGRAPALSVRSGERGRVENGCHDSHLPPPCVCASRARGRPPAGSAVAVVPGVQWQPLQGRWGRTPALSPSVWGSAWNQRFGSTCPFVPGADVSSRFCDSAVTGWCLVFTVGDSARSPGLRVEGTHGERGQLGARPRRPRVTSQHEQTWASRGVQLRWPR